jgi:DNA repair photolyase
MLVGITERGDAALDTAWMEWCAEDKPAILISKNPIRLLGRLGTFEQEYGKPANVIVHCVITGFGSTLLEPNVPHRDEAMLGYDDLLTWAFLAGDERRTVLRVDPIIPTEKGIKKALTVIRDAQHHGINRLRISFLDAYKHVQKRLVDARLPSLPYDMHAPLKSRRQALRDVQEVYGKDIEICGEPGMVCTGCVSAIDCEVLGIEPMRGGKKQRKDCPCLRNKFELLTSRQQCKHGCLYCYWKS